MGPIWLHAVNAGVKVTPRANVFRMQYLNDIVPGHAKFNLIDLHDDILKVTLFRRLESNQ
jgi:hypothetical protein